MVVHLVHADQDGNLAVVAILLESGKTTLSSKNYGTTCPGKGERRTVGQHHD
jgi:carbonic anhydrase